MRNLATALATASICLSACSGNDIIGIRPNDNALETGDKVIDMNNPDDFAAFDKAILDACPSDGEVDVQCMEDAQLGWVQMIQGTVYNAGVHPVSKKDFIEVHSTNPMFDYGDGEPLTAIFICDTGVTLCRGVNKGDEVRVEATYQHTGVGTTFPYVTNVVSIKITG